MSEQAAREMTPDELEAAGLPRSFHSRPASPPSSPTALKTLLDKFAAAVIEVQQWVRAGVVTYAKQADAELSTARAAVESLVEARDKEIERLTKIVDAWGAMDLQKLDEEHRELSALRSSGLSPEEAALLIDLIDVDLCDLGCGIVHSTRCEAGLPDGSVCGRAFHHPGHHKPAMAATGLRSQAITLTPEAAAHLIRCVEYFPVVHSASADIFAALRALSSKGQDK